MRKVSTLVLILLICFVWLPILNIGIVKAESTIYIRADGSVEGIDKILRDGNVYTLISDINGSIVVERGNVVLNGAGYTLQGSGTGIDLSYRSNVTIKNVTIRLFYYGIWFNVSSSNTITGNIISDNSRGINLDYSSNNRIHGNHITKNYDPGIYLWKSSNTIISENNITDNTIDGIHLFLSSNNNVSRNNINNNGNGIWISVSSNNNIYENRITNNCGGIHLEASSNNIYENNITNNIEGIFVGGALNNIIHHNNFINNTKQVYDIAWVWWAPDDATPSVNIWDNGVEGNYWSDYNGTDANGDGIGDTPYIIDENNQDNYPLMEPVPVIPEFPSWAPLLIMLVVVMVVAVIYRHNLYKPNQGRRNQ